MIMKIEYERKLLGEEKQNKCKEGREMLSANYLFQFIFFSYFSFILRLIHIFIEVS